MKRGARLELLHGCKLARAIELKTAPLTSDIGGLNVVLDLLDVLLELVKGDLGVFNDQVDLQHPDTWALGVFCRPKNRSQLTVTDGDELGSSPNETILLDRSDLLLQSLHVGLVIPRLDLEGDNRLGDVEGLTGGKLLGDLGGLSLVVGSNSLGLDSVGLGSVLLVVGTEKVDLIVVLLSGSWG